MPRTALSRLPASAALAALVWVFALPGSSRAQLGLPRGGDRLSVQLELTKPFFKDPGLFAGLGFVTSIFDASVVVPVEGWPTLFARLGISYGTIEGGSASATLSNPRLGVLLGGQGATYGEVHVDLPFAKEFGGDDYATGVALITEFERLERFAPEGWSIGGSLTREAELGSDVTVGGRLGATLAIPTEGGADTELYALYSAFARMPAGSLLLGAELSGIAVATEGGLDFNERTYFFATLSLALPDAGPTPEFFVRIPLDDSLRNSLLNFVVAARVRLGG